MYRIELTSYKKARKHLLIALLSIILIDIILIAILLMLNEDIIINDILKDIIIGIVSRVIPSIAVTIFISYKFLRSIPENTEKKINTLLNERLSYETTQHEGTMRALNPDNAQLSLDHRDINRNLIHIREKINSYESEKKSQFSLLDGNGKNISSSIETLSAFSSLYQETNKKAILLETQNNKLTTELKEANERIQLLEEQNSELTKKNKELSWNRDIRRENFLE